MKKVCIQRQKMLTFWKLVSDFSEGVWASVHCCLLVKCDAFMKIVAIEHDENMGYSTASTPAPDRTYTDDEMLR